MDNYPANKLFIGLDFVYKHEIHLGRFKNQEDRVNHITSDFTKKKFFVKSIFA